MAPWGNRILRIKHFGQILLVESIFGAFKMNVSLLGLFVPQQVESQASDCRHIFRRIADLNSALLELAWNPPHLGLPEFRILKTELRKREIVIAIESTQEWAVSAGCGNEIREFHKNGRQLRLRHPPTFGRPLIIEIRLKRFRYLTC